MAFIGQASNEINDSPVKAADVSSVLPETVEMRTKTMNVANGARAAYYWLEVLSAFCKTLNDRRRTEKDTKN